MASETAFAILEKKQLLEEDLRRVEKQIYDLEGEYLQETVKDGNILRGWDSYLGKQASSGAIRRINRFREADRLFSASSVTATQASNANAKDGADKKESAGGGGGGGAKVKDSKKSGSNSHRKRARDDGD